jgi:hypothetical protein
MDRAKGGVPRAGIYRDVCLLKTPSYFNPRPRHEEAPALYGFNPRVRASASAITPRARRGRRRHCFNPRARASAIATVHVQHVPARRFNPRARASAIPGGTGGVYGYVLFQSARSRERDPTRPRGSTSTHRFNPRARASAIEHTTHGLRSPNTFQSVRSRERDHRARRGARRERGFNPRARASAIHPERGVDCRPKCFNPRARASAILPCRRDAGRLVRVSIRALARARSTQPRAEKRTNTFQSARSRERDPDTDNGRRPPDVVSIRALARARSLRWSQRAAGNLVSIRALARARSVSRSVFAAVSSRFNPRARASAISRRRARLPRC